MAVGLVDGAVSRIGMKVLPHLALVVEVKEGWALYRKEEDSLSIEGGERDAKATSLVAAAVEGTRKDEEEASRERRERKTRKIRHRKA